MCPNPPDALRITPESGHEIKLGGDTGEGCGRALLPRSPRHGRCYGETEMSNPRHPIITDLVWLKNWASSRSLSIIVGEQPSQALSTHHKAALAPYPRL